MCCVGMEEIFLEPAGKGSNRCERGSIYSLLFWFLLLLLISLYRPQQYQDGLLPVAATAAASLTNLLQEIHDEKVTLDDDVLDQLLKLAEEAYGSGSIMTSSSLSGGGAKKDSLSWFARLLELVAESELEGPPCTLHR